jgi:serine/threonine protein kinase
MSIVYDVELFVKTYGIGQIQYVYKGAEVDPAIKSSTGQLAHNYLLGQRYHIIGVVGKGGFGAVYKARDSRYADRLVAVKEMNRGGLSPQQIAEVTDTFKREALILSGLAHPNLPRIYDHFVDNGRWYIVMDFIEGETLEELLLKATGGYFRVEQVLEIGIRLCGVLDYLHSQLPPIIFRDLKPANIMLTPADSLYLIDFGVARRFKLGKARDTIPFGSPGYAAPEQYGSAQTTPQSDIYSLGVTLYQMLTGIDPAQTPFQFAPLQLPGQAMPAGLDLLIMQMLEIDEDRRPAGVSIVKRELQHIAVQQGNSLQSGTFPTQQSGAVLQHPISILSPSPVHALPAPPTPARGFTFSTCRGHAGVVRTVAWASDGQNIASASDDTTVRVWDVATGRRIFSYLNHDGEVFAVAWSPDGQHIASGGSDHSLRIWNVHTGRKVFINRDRSSAVHAVAWSPGGGHIASGNSDGRIHVWEVSTWRHLLTCHGHAGIVHTVAWSPDGKHIASGSSDMAVHVWQAMTGRDVFAYHGHTDVVHAVAWSPDGQRLASAGSDQTVQVWQAV